MFRPDHTIQSRTTQGPNGEPLVAAEYEHNARDFVTKADENGRASEFGYDAREQLNRVTTPEGDVILYEYDASGNRTVRKAIIQGAESDKQETIDIEQFMEMILAAMNGKAGEAAVPARGGKGKAYGRDKDHGNSQGKGNGNSQGKSQGKGNGNSCVSSVEDQSGGQVAVAAPEKSKPVQILAKGGGGGKSGGSSGGNSGKGNGNGNNGKGVGSCGGSTATGTDNALERGQGKKLGLYKKLQNQWAGQLQPGQLQPGNIEHILAVIDNIVNGEVN
ncbi:RHS repeat domain-containing protein, partial [Paenibacillaceae bacterium T2]|nr:RHS repeat domain-containing protein [Paenibacillaceae bacterium T2]